MKRERGKGKRERRKCLPQRKAEEKAGREWEGNREIGGGECVLVKGWGWALYD